MIRKIKFNNFYSFKDEQEIIFTATKKSSYSYHQSIITKDQITKVASFIGGNASGKTNIIKLLSFIKYFLTSGNNQNHESNIPFKTFFNNKDISNFYIEFEFNKKIFYYKFSLHNNTIMKEKLSFKEIDKKGVELKSTIFSRKIKNYLEINDEIFPSFNYEFVKKNLREDISLLPFLNNHYQNEIISKIYEYFYKMTSNVKETGKFNFANKKNLVSYMQDNKLKQSVTDFIKNFDLGLEGFEVTTEIDEYGSELLKIKGLHSSKSKIEKLDFIYESEGTRSIFFVILQIINAIKNNSVALIDEIETGLHPEALSKIISYFIDENEENHAQLIFTSHSLDFLNSLDMHQIYLVEKNNKGESFCYRLNQVEDIRSDENFKAKYMSAAYGAFPRITI